jgi:hypothetical protein
MTHRKWAPALALAGLAMGCSQETTGPDAPVPVAFALVPAESEKLIVCKEGPAGTYNFNVTYTGGTPGGPAPITGPFTVNAGACRHIASKGVPLTATVTEAAVPMGIQYASANVVANGTVTPVTINDAAQSVTLTFGQGATPSGAVITFVNELIPQVPGAKFLIIDEDGLDNGLRVNKSGGLITPSGPNFWTKLNVNDGIPGNKQRAVLKYFANNPGKQITVVTGQTGDEGWFAPTCTPEKWLPGSNKDDNDCVTGAQQQTGIDNYFGKNGSAAIPSQERLDKIPHVIPLRASGLELLRDMDVCAVVYDSDVGLNYDHSKPDLGINGNLQGETLGIVAFHVDDIIVLNGFSSSTLPQVKITIKSTSICGNWTIPGYPVPTSSSVPNDRVPPGSPSGYL